jgi:hypothetical protein
MSLADRLKKLIYRSKTPETVTRTDRVRGGLLTPVTVVLLGKTGSGKSSIVRHLTGNSTVEIGGGSAPCTKDSQAFNIPIDQSLLKLIDTRGLGETGYDPDAELQRTFAVADALIVTMRLSDMNQESILTALKKFRKQIGAAPVLVVHTCLHELYPGRSVDHHIPYIDFGSDMQACPKEYQRVREAMLHHRSLFRTFRNTNSDFTSIDFTDPHDGFALPNFGSQQLIESVVGLTSKALLQRWEVQIGKKRPPSWPWRRNPEADAFVKDFQMRLRSALPSYEGSPDR